MAREIFCLVVGPPSVVHQGQVITSVSGESTDIVPAIAHLLGFDQSIPGGSIKDYVDCDIKAAFV